MTEECKYGKENKCPILSTCGLATGNGESDGLSYLFGNPLELRKWSGEAKEKTYVWIDDNKTTIYRCKPSGKLIKDLEKEII